MLVWIFCRNFRRLFNAHIFDALLCLEVPLHPVTLTIVIPQTEGVTFEAINIRLTLYPTYQ